MSERMEPWVALSTGWNAHRFSDGEALAWEVRSMGFEWVEIGPGTPPEVVRGIVEARRGKVIDLCSLHAGFRIPPEDRWEGLALHVRDEEERRKAVEAVKRSLEAAAELEIERVVLPLGQVTMTAATSELEALALEGKLHKRDYVRWKLEMVKQRAASAELDPLKASLETLIGACERLGLRIGLESAKTFEGLPTLSELEALTDEFGSSGRLGAWHDFSHTQCQANLGFLDHEEYLRRSAHGLVGCHLSDVIWPQETHRIPRPDANIPLECLLGSVPAGVPWVWEVNARQRRLEIAAALAEWREKWREPGSDD